MLERVTVKQLMASGGVGALGVLFAYQLMTGQAEARTALKDMGLQHAQMIDAANATKELAGRAYMANERVLYVLQVMCVNQATTAEGRRLCLSDSSNGLVTR